mgnify:CR=1 FL=1
MIDDTPQQETSGLTSDGKEPARHISGAHLLHLVGITDIRVRELLGDDRADIVVRWHRQAIGHGRDIIDPSTGEPTSDPPVARLSAIPTAAVAELLNDDGIKIPTRRQCRDWAVMDLRNGGDGVDPELALEAARLAADPDLRGTGGSAEERICGVPQSIYETLQPDEQRKVLDGRVIPPPRAPLAVARWLVRRYFLHQVPVPGRRGRALARTLIRVDQTWYYYGALRRGELRKWTAINNPEWLAGELQAVLGKHWYVHSRTRNRDDEYSLKWWNPDSANLAMVEKALAGELAVYPGTHARELPDHCGWFRNAYLGTRVLCRNGLLDLDSGRVDPPTPLWFTLTRLEADYNHDADPAAPSEWLKVLRAQWPDDPGALICLQQWFGYVLSGRTDLQKFMLIIGPRGSAKSLIAAVLGALVGNVIELGLDALNSHFGLQEAHENGATLAVMSDMRFGARDSSLAVARLLAITGGDEVSIDRKHKGVVTTRLGVRFHGSANELPRLGDHSGALVDRLLVLETQHSFRGTASEDPGLKDRIITNELGQVLRWAVEGLALLNAADGTFTRSKAAAQLVEETLEEFSNVRQFVEQCCEIGSGDDFVDLSDLFRVWGKWAAENRTGERMSKNAFAKALKTMNRSPIKPGQKKMPKGGPGKWLVVHGIKHAQTTFTNRSHGLELRDTISTDALKADRERSCGSATSQRNDAFIDSRR